MGKDLYLIAKIQQNGNMISAPYDAELTLNGVVGKWLGGSMALFNMGRYGQVPSTENHWTVTGLNAGSYTVTWYLTAASNEPNAFDQILAVSEAQNVNVTAAADPFLSETRH